MFDHYLALTLHAIELLPFSAATWFVLFVLFFFVWIFTKANHNPNSAIRFEELFIDTVTQKTSPYKLGYLVGIIVSTWVIITMTDRDKLTFDILGTYLAFLLGGAGWTAFVTNKFGNGNPVVVPPVQATEQVNVNVQQKNVQLPPDDDK